MDEKERNYQIEKYLQQGTIPSSYRPINCFPMLWKILNAQIKENIY